MSLLSLPQVVLQPSAVKFLPKLPITRIEANWRKPFLPGRRMFWAGVFLGLLVGANIGVILACLLGGSARREAARKLPDPDTPFDPAVLHDAGEDPTNQLSNPEPVTYLDRYPHA